MRVRVASEAVIVAEARPTAALRQYRVPPGRTTNKIWNLDFCELMPDAVSFLEHNFFEYLHGRTEMENQRHRPGSEPRQAYDQFVTDSMILSDEFVESSLVGNRSDTRYSHRAPQGFLNGLLLSLLFWALILLPFLIF